MIIVKPAGTLTVTYEFKDAKEEIKCSKCAETIKTAGKNSVIGLTKLKAAKMELIRITISAPLRDIN